jgi:predicted TIM-barrel fold metal-dependent hydrolase
MILSSDAHCGALAGDYRPYLASQWHEEFDAWVAAIVSPWMDTNDVTNWDSDARLAAMDAEGVTGEVLFPNSLPPFYDVLTHLSGVPRDRRDYERRWAGLQAHNRWLLEFCNEAPARRRGLIQLLPNDVEEAVRELHWAAEHNAIGGAMLPAVPTNHTVPPYYDDRYEPLWRAAVELDLPLHQHQGSGSPNMPPGQEDVARSVQWVDLELWTRLTMSHLIVGGVFERHPELKFVWTEMNGLRWAVEDLERMTRQLPMIQTRYAANPNQYSLPSVFGSRVVEGLSLTPIEYFRRNCYLGASLLSPSEVHWINVLGSDRVMWGHDFPHPEGSVGQTTESLRANFAALPVADCRTILSGTAAAIYHFDVDALVPIAQRVGPPVAEVHVPLTELPPSRGSAFWPTNELAVALNRI